MANTYAFMFQSSVDGQRPAWPTLPLRPGTVVTAAGLKFQAHLNGRKMILNDWMPMIQKWRATDQLTGEVVLLHPSRCQGPLALGQLLGCPELDDAWALQRLRGTASAVGELME